MLARTFCFCFYTNHPYQPQVPAEIILNFVHPNKANEDSIRIKELFIWHYSYKSPITFLKGSLYNRTAGSLKTAEGRGARLCIPILTRHLFVILPSWAFQPSCCVSSLFMATLHDQNARWTSPTMHWNKVIQNEASSYPPYWIFV